MALAAGAGLCSRQIKSNMPEQRNAPRRWWIGAALAAITLGLFSPLWHYGFLDFDDQAYVTENPYVRSGLNANSVAWAFHTSTTGNWIPLTWISHILDVQFFGLNAGGHHLTNVLLHTANVALLFLLWQRMTGAVWRSALVAGLFGWHPAHVESVAWIAERKDVLSAFFWLLSLWAYVRHAAKPGWARYVLSLALFGLALLAKPMAVTLPFVLLLLDYWPLGRCATTCVRQSAPNEPEAPAFPRLPLARLLVEKVPFLALSGVGCALALWAQERSNAVASAELLPLEHRLGHVLVSYLDYIGMLLYPRHLAIFYPYPLHEKAGMILFGGVVVAAVFVLTAAQWRRRPHLLVGWLWFVGTLVPVIGLIQVGRQALADRYTYLPAIGLFIMVVWGVAELALRHPPVKFLAPVLGVAMLAATSVQLPCWKDTRTVFERAREVTQDNYLAVTMLGSIRAGEGDLNGAIKLYREALGDKANYAEAHFFLARALDQQGKTAEAGKEYATALRLNPFFQQAHIFFGLLLARQKQDDLARAQYEAVIKINPQSATAHNDLARLLQTQGRLEESIRHYSAALQFDPSLAEAHNNLGILYLQKGQLAEGATQLREALRLNPGNVETQANLATVLVQQEQWKEAADLLQKIAPMRSDNANVRYQYGLALAHQGKTRDAMSQYAKALLLTPDFAEALNALAWIAATDPRAELRNGPQAIELAGRACELTARRQPAMLLTLAAAYAEGGRFGEAADTARQTAEVAGAAGLKELQETAARMRDLFEKRQAFRDAVNKSE
jgi:tetratricopeptide (TPR) repeat protein